MTPFLPADLFHRLVTQGASATEAFRLAFPDLAAGLTESAIYARASRLLRKVRSGMSGVSAQTNVRIPDMMSGNLTSGMSGMSGNLTSGMSGMSGVSTQTIMRYDTNKQTMQPNVSRRAPGKSQHHDTHPEFDAEAVKSRVDLVEFARGEVPDLQLVGREWEGCCPIHGEKTPSFKVDPEKQIWNCFGCGRGGDLFSLVMELRGCSFREAVAEVAGLGGALSPPAARRTPGGGGQGQTGKSDPWTVIFPAPSPPPALPAHPRHGQAGACWHYVDDQGRILFAVARFERAGGGKEVLPVAWCRDEQGREGWRFKAFPEPRPLYGLAALVEEDGPVLVVEGEKAAEAARGLMAARPGRGWVVTTSSGGSSAAGKSDWAPLAGRRVVIWPDHDAPGTKYAALVMDLAREAGAVDVRIVTVPEEFPPGWDLADPPPEGWDAERLAGLAETALPPDWPPPEAPPPAGRKIPWKGGKLHEAVEAAEGALLSAGEEIFQRGGRLVRVARTPRGLVRGLVKRPDGGVTLLEVDATWLALVITRHATISAWDPKARKELPINCPPTLARSLCVNAGGWGFPALAGLVETPTLRPDGSILEQPGFDEASGLYLDGGGVSYPPIPRAPTRDEAELALERLSEPFRDFPFREPHHRSVALAAALTALVRPSLRSAPMFAFSSPKMGSGKSLLADIVALIASGRRASVISQAASPEEEAKAIFSLLMEGERVVSLDNIERPLGSEILCSILTQESYKARVLGESRTVTVPTAMTWLATGNNLVVEGDLSTRILIAHLDPGVERPEERTFSRDLLAWVPEHRVGLVVAGLTVLLGYLAAGRPAMGLAPYGRFEGWSGLVRSALVWLGQPDPCISRVDVESRDPVRGVLGALLAAWHGFLGEEIVNVSTLMARANETPNMWADDLGKQRSSLKEALLEASGGGREINARRIGKFLMRHENRIEGGFRLVRVVEFDIVGRAIAWRVLRMETETVRETYETS